jgi:hypothetical protein
MTEERETAGKECFVPQFQLIRALMCKCAMVGEIIVRYSIVSLDFDWNVQIHVETGST